MTDRAMFKACYSDWKVIKTRGCVQVIFELPLETSDTAYQALGGMPQPSKEIWCAVARLQSGKDGEAHAQLKSTVETTPAPKPDPSVRAHRKWEEITPAQQAGIRCNEPAFVKFLAGRYRNCIDSTESASQLVRELCEVSSRSDIRAGTKSAATWARIEETYQTWLLAERLGIA